MEYQYPDVNRLTQWLVDNKNALDGKIEITEKLDGSNFSFHKNDMYDTPIGVWRSRSDIIKPENLNNFRQAIEFVEPIVAKIKDTEVIFGENVAIHHRMRYDERRYPFYAFGIYNTDTEKFQRNWQSRCNKLGIPTVIKIIADEELTLDYLLRLRSGESMIGDAREGIVLKNYEDQSIYKLVDPKYEESHNQKPPRVPITIDEKTQLFVDNNCTEARVLKAIFRLHDEDGEPFDLPMMKVLPNAVALDIYKECEVPDDINVKQMRKLIADISRETLKKYLNGEIE